MSAFTSEQVSELVAVIRGETQRLDTLIRQLQGGVISGVGAPTVAARPGTLYRNLSGGAGVSVYVKETGTGTAGWTAL